VGGRMDSIQCAVVLAKLERFEWEIEQRMAIGARYTQYLSDLAKDKAELLSLRSDRSHVYAQYTILALDRGRLQKHLNERGIPTAVHYPIPIHLQPAYTQFNRRDVPVSESLASRVISLPMHADLSEDTQRRIVSAIAEAPVAR